MIELIGLIGLSMFLIWFGLIVTMIGFGLVGIIFHIVEISIFAVVDSLIRFATLATLTLTKLVKLIHSH
jgi:hypothetical protein